MSVPESASFTSAQRGSLMDVGSLQRSRTAMLLTVAGRARRNLDMSKGLKRRTTSTPIFSPAAMSFSAASLATAEPEPIITITRSASSQP